MCRKFLVSKDLVLPALCLIWWTICSPQSLLAAGPNTDKLSDRVNRFVQTKERQMESARKKLLKAIDGVQKEIKQSDLDPDAKRLLLQRIKSDQKKFAATKELPSCDELLEPVIAYADANEQIIASIDEFRKKLADKAIRKEGDPDVSEALTKLEEKVLKLLGGRIDFTEGSDWRGKRQGPEGNSVQLYMHIGQVAGNVFRGRLEQTSNAATDIMKVEGQRDGNHVVIRTTEMIRGDYRSLEFTGYFLGRRIVASVDGVNTAKKRATGWISLWKQ
ncbi:MAG TPA: hypothetical protein VG055_23125 [Planctomycetaceae bacterium]|jgi:hypothetical protein|nr:hypothetical protein [Planctomycetaceae bacterium]